MTFDEYVFKKTMLKVNLFLSNGTHVKGYIRDEVINKLVKSVDKYGIYKMIYASDCENRSINTKHWVYRLDYIDYVDPYDFSNFIEFTLAEHRNLKLKNIIR